MANANTLEERLTKIENELAELRNRLCSRDSKSNWITKMVGRFENDPVFDEIARLGQELRDAEEPDGTSTLETKSD
ncbi:MAG: hypothetical protein SFV81_13155 [Pirellulaceae bacterium]|nr:hypothetical protein [Pirellulaceae bacterium]